MNRKTETADIRSTATRLIKSEDVSESLEESRREMLKDMIAEAKEHGFSAAEVIRAVLTPIFERKPKGCDCFSCIARRQENTDFETDYDEERVQIATE